MSGQIQTLATPPPVSVQTLLYNIYLAAASGGSSGASWGSITGTLSAQTDLQTALNARLPLTGGTLTPAANTTALTLGGSLTGSNAQAMLSLNPTWNTTGDPALIYGRVTNTASGASARFIDLGTVADGSSFYVNASDGHCNSAKFKVLGTSSYLDSNCVVAGAHIVEGGFIALNNAQNVVISRGTGSPEGVLSRSVGSLFLRTDGGAGTTLYVKESGTGNTGWVAK